MGHDSLSGKTAKISKSHRNRPILLTFCQNIIDISTFPKHGSLFASTFRHSQSMIPLLRLEMGTMLLIPTIGARQNHQNSWIPPFSWFLSPKSSIFQLSQSMIPLLRVMKGIMLLISHNRCMSEASEPLNPCIFTDFFSQNHQYLNFHKAWFLFQGS